MISASVAPLGRFNRSMIFAALLPSRAAPAFRPALGAFLGAPAFGAAFAALAFGAVLAFLGATCARFAATRAFLPVFGFSTPVAWAVPFSSVFNVVIPVSPMVVVAAVT